jgi:nucleotide-binding universal stress UspA family protein
MRTLNRILVPMDFSESSRAALEVAKNFGELFGAEIDILHVWRPPEEVSSSRDLLVEFEKSDAGCQMKDVLASLEGQDTIEVRGCLAPGGYRDVPEAILKVAEREYDLVVLGAHEHHGLSRLLRRGAVEKIMSQAPCPVLAVHGN